MRLALLSFSFVLFPGALGFVVAAMGFWRTRSLISRWLLAASGLWVFIGLIGSDGAFGLAAQTLVMAVLVGVGRRLRAFGPLRRTRIASGAIAGLFAMSIAATVGLALGASHLGVIPAPYVSFLNFHLRDVAEVRDWGNRSAGWLAHPNIWGVTALAPALVVFGLPRVPRWRWLALIPLLSTAAVAGSRSAMLAVLTGILVHAIVTTKGASALRDRKALLVVLTAFCVAAIVVWVSPLASRTFVPVERSSATTAENLLRGSEALNDPLWYRPTVGVEPTSSSDTGPQVWRVTKLAPGPGSRVQQRVSLEPDRMYTVGVDLSWTDEETSPGVLSWVEKDDGADALVARFVDGALEAHGVGDIAVLDYRAADLGDEWTRLEVVFANTSESPLRLEIGVTPDQRPGVHGSSVLVRRFQLAEGNELPAYRPTYAPDREAIQARESASLRLRIFRAAWRGILDAPILGHGSEAFSEFAARELPSVEGRITHAHNIFLQTWFAYGVLGLMSLSIMFRGMATSRLALPVVIAVGAANLFDATFWTAHMSYLACMGAGLLDTTPDSQKPAMDPYDAGQAFHGGPSKA